MEQETMYEEENIQDESDSISQRDRVSITTEENRQDAELRKMAKQSPKRRVDVDAELEEMLSRQKALIKVIGAGGGGNNTIDRVKEVGIEGAEAIAVNTDAQDLLFTSADRKILLGREVTKGMGAG